jgi:hypothetical protein
MSDQIRLAPVRDKKGLSDFINVPWHIYANDAQWIPPLKFERRDALSVKHPYFHHAEWRAWVLYDGRLPVGRISAQIDALHQERYGDHTGYFGMLEAPNDPGAFRTLFGAAQEWLIERKQKRCVGPFNLGINQEIGVLVDGFDTPPFLMMAHSPRYYHPRIVENGFEGVKDLFAYEVSPDFEHPRVMESLVQRFTPRFNLRQLDRKRLDEELEVMRDIFNDAWSNNWGFVPFTREEFAAVGRELMTWIREDFIQIVEVDGKPAGFIAGMPNLNEAIADLDGKLFPIGWAKLLWRVKVHYPRTARVPLMGVRKEYQHTRLGPSLAFILISAVARALVEAGVKSVEMSWILDDNAGMRNIIETIGGYPTKRYRMYAKEL